MPPERSAEAAPERPYGRKGWLIRALDGVALAVIGLVVLNVTIAEPAGGAKNAMVPRTIATALGVMMLTGGGGWFAFSLFRLIGVRRERS